MTTQPEGGTAYEPELGQAVFGNPTAEHEVPDRIGDWLYDLSDRVLEVLYGDDHNAMPAYATEFENEVFAFFPYWWGDCECGFDEAEGAWCDVHDHTPECFHTQYMAFCDSFTNSCSEDFYREQMNWLDARGITSSYGVMVRCDCGHQAEWEAWRSEHDHADTCPTVRPNFLHKPSGTRVHWYKYIGRGMSADRTLTKREWRALFAECVASINQEANS